MKRWSLALAALPLVLAWAGLAGCGASAPPPATRPGDVAVKAPSETETPEPTPTPTTDARTVIITCIADDGSTATFSTPEQAWSQSFDFCEGEVFYSTVSETEMQAVTVAYGEDGADIGSLGILYGMCAQRGRAAYEAYDGAPTTEQQSELQGELVLCPDHPDRAAIRKLIVNGVRDVQLEASGQIFNSGVYLVGKEVPPGTYVALNVEGCYWERQNRSGGIIDNGFHDAAKRVQVTIRKGDYAFMSRGCGQWRPLG